MDFFIYVLSSKYRKSNFDNRCFYNNWGQIINNWGQIIINNWGQIINNWGQIIIKFSMGCGGDLALGCEELPD